MSEKSFNDSFSMLLTLGRKPRHPTFTFLVRHYPLISSGIVTLILAISTFSLIQYRNSLVIVVYWIYYWAKGEYRKKQTILGLYYKSEQMQFGRSIILIAGIFIFLFFLYNYTDYLNAGRGADTLWLLFLLPTFIMK